MGYGTDLADAILQQPITTVETADRRDRERVLTRPEATHSGQIVERPEPAAAPIEAVRAAPTRWD